MSDNKNDMEENIFKPKIDIKKLHHIEKRGDHLFVSAQVSTIIDPPFNIKREGSRYRSINDPSYQGLIKDIVAFLKEKEGATIFPFCCEDHIKLSKRNGFNRINYGKVRKMVAHKIIYTIEHIVEHQYLSDWYKDITDFIEWIVLSFGDLPIKCGGPLYLDQYFFIVESRIKDTKEILPDRKTKLLEWVEEVRIQGKTEGVRDFKVLFMTYDKWLKIFPFDISFLNHLKSKFKDKIPIFHGKPVLNKYSKKYNIKLHTKSTLIDALINLTDIVLSEINTLSLYEKGILTEPEKIKLELIVSERKLQLNQGYKSDSKNTEKQYRKMIKKWFRDEKKFIDEITPLLNNKTDLDKIESKSNRTKKLIEKKFEAIDDNGWEYAFKKESDFFTFTNLLCDFFEYKDYVLPNTIIELKRGCKTKLGKVLGEIHKDLSNEPSLKGDEDFFKIIRTLNHFTNEMDLYKVLTR